MKKQLLFILLIICITVGLVGCASNSIQNEPAPPESSKSSVDGLIPTATLSVNPAASSGSEVYSDDPSEAEVLKKIAVCAVPTLDGDMCVFITNNSSVVVDELEVQVNYRDLSGMIIDVDSDGHDMILPGHTVVSKMDTPDKYTDYETSVDIELGVHPRYKNHADSVEVTANQGEDCVIVQITNNSEVIIDEIEYIVVLYSGNDISSVKNPNDVTNVESGKRIIEKESTYGDEYDRFEVFLNQAHTFGLN